MAPSEYYRLKSLSREQQKEKKAAILKLNQKFRPSTNKQRCRHTLTTLRKLLAPEKPLRLSQILLKKWAKNTTARTRGQHLVLIVGDGRWLGCEEDLWGKIPFRVISVDPCFEKPPNLSRVEDLDRAINAVGESIIRLGAKMEDVNLRDHVADPTKVKFVHVLLPRAHVLLQDFEGHIKTTFPFLSRIDAYVEPCCGYKSKLEGATETKLTLSACGCHTIRAKLLQKSYC